MSWLRDKLHSVWFYCVTSPWVYITRCAWGRHPWFVMHVTNGTTSVRCQRCRVRREPTQEEREANRYYWYTPEQLVEQRAKEEAIYQALREYGFKVD